MQVISFPAQVYKVQTLADGGVRVTLDLPETTIPEMAMLAECQRFGVMLRVNAEPQDNKQNGNKLQDLLKS